MRRRAIHAGPFAVSPAGRVAAAAAAARAPQGRRLLEPVAIDLHDASFADRRTRAAVHIPNQWVSATVRRRGA